MSYMRQHEFSVYGMWQLYRPGGAKVLNHYGYLLLH